MNFPSLSTTTNPEQLLQQRQFLLLITSSPPQGELATPNWTSPYPTMRILVNQVWTPQRLIGWQWCRVMVWKERFSMEEGENSRCQKEEKQDYQRIANRLPYCYRETFYRGLRVSRGGYLVARFEADTGFDVIMLGGSLGGADGVFAPLMELAISLSSYSYSSRSMAMICLLFSTSSSKAFICSSAAYALALYSFVSRSASLKLISSCWFWQMRSMTSLSQSGGRSVPVFVFFFIISACKMLSLSISPSFLSFFRFTRAFSSCNRQTSCFYLVTSVLRISISSSQLSNFWSLSSSARRRPCAARLSSSSWPLREVSSRRRWFSSWTSWLFLSRRFRFSEQSLWLKFYRSRIEFFSWAFSREMVSSLSSRYFMPPSLRITVRYMI